MLRHAGIGVAMGNASDEVKACADMVTESVDEDGIEKLLSAPFLSFGHPFPVEGQGQVSKLNANSIIINTHYENKN